MSKERLEEAKKWLGQMRLILSTKTDKDEIAYVQSKIDLFEWMIEQVEQNNRYREVLNRISITTKEGTTYRWARRALEGEGE